MTTTNSTRSTKATRALTGAPNNQTHLSGAEACMNALRKLDQAASLGCGYVEGDTDQDYFDERRAHVQEFISALGPLDARVEGVIATMAEYIHMSIQAGQPNLEHGKWMPMAAKAELVRVSAP